MSDILKKLQAAGAFVENSDKGGRGRPKVSDTRKSEAYKITMDVANTQVRLPDKRGAQAEAIRLVAAKRGMTVDGVKKALKRCNYFDTTKHARLYRDLGDMLGELERRMSRFPPTMQAYLLDHSSPYKLLDFLREHNINGDCPQWLLTAYFDAKEKD